jgi:hypothetical protein
MNSHDQDFKTSDIGLLIFMMAAIWLWIVLR